MLLYTTSASAVELIVSSAAGGTYHKFTTVIASELEKQNIDVEVKIAGNCILGKKMYEDSESAIMFNSEATNAVNECNIPLTQEIYFTNIFTAGWVIVSKDGTLGSKMGVVSYMKQIVNDLPVKLVPYKNTKAIKAAFLAGEIDSGLVVQAIADGLDAHIILDTMDNDKGQFKSWKNNDLTLNYYLITKGNVDPVVLNAIVKIEKLKSIANAKKLQPINLSDVDKQIKYLIDNEGKWK
jgi:hypothetical protein